MKTIDYWRKKRLLMLEILNLINIGWNFILVPFELRLNLVFECENTNYDDPHILRNFINCPIDRIIAIIQEQRTVYRIFLKSLIDNSITVHSETVYNLEHCTKWLLFGFIEIFICVGLGLQCVFLNLFEKDETMKFCVETKTFIWLHFVCHKIAFSVKSNEDSSFDKKMLKFLF